MKPQFLSQPDSRQVFSRNFVFIGALLTLAYLILFVFQARIDIQLETDNPRASFFKVYWAGPDQVFSEHRMAYAPIKAVQENRFLYITSLADINRIRIDPLEYPGKTSLRFMRISQPGFKPMTFSQATDYEPFKRNQQIDLSAAESGLHIETLARDGHFEIPVAAEREWQFPIKHLLNIAGILLGLALFMRILGPLMGTLSVVPLLLLLVWGLVLLMALSTGLSQHPDEVVHLEAISYYAQHLFPPALNDPEIASSYSIYGHSRLSDYEIYYPLAGYFQAIPELFNATALFGARLFSLLMLALLTGFSLLQPAFRPFTLPLLLSAQSWYLYSYANSDAFALSLSLFVAYLAASSRSPLYRFLQSPAPTAYISRLLGFGLVFGALLMLKANYLFFVLFLLLYLLWRLGQGDFPDRSRLFKRLGLLTLIALTMVGLRFALDIHANGWQSADVQAEMREHYADKAYKPSTALEDRHPMLSLKERGYSAGYTLDQARWFEKSFQSAFGVYGFSEFYASQTWYDLVRLLTLALLLVLVVGALRRPGYGRFSLLLIVTLSAGGLIAVSAWHSWTVAFQPQGRYLMPILPMLGILYYHIRQQGVRGPIEWLSLLLFLLAVYSFWHTGLGNLSSPMG